ncbi:acyl-CoA dehydrogenase [Vibrio metoecus]|nr:acyl-CoA dehydrogenase [Vibrio metoecus]PAR63996.1 acyl-CoA dehydrogenase [Vibrio metoecus]RBM26325.1 acyl-CoA dehydrogenase [Vibrio tarriae]
MTWVGYLNIQKTIWGELSQAWTLPQADLGSVTLLRSSVWPSVKKKNAEPKLRVDGLRFMSLAPD